MRQEGDERLEGYIISMAYRRRMLFDIILSTNRDPSEQSDTVQTGAPMTVYICYSLYYDQPRANATGNTLTKNQRQVKGTHKHKQNLLKDWELSKGVRGFEKRAQSRPKR